MSSGDKITQMDARQLARSARRLIMTCAGELTVSRIKEAGSIRRKRPQCGDVELVAIPRVVDGRNLLLARLDELLAAGRIHKALKGAKQLPRWGQRYRAFTIDEAHLDRYLAIEFGDAARTEELARRRARLARVHVELFLADERNWGVQLAIRTGSADFSRRLVTAVLRRGEARVGEGCLREPFPDGLTKKQIRAVAIIDCPDEQTLFRYAGMDLVEPRFREVPAPSEVRSPESASSEVRP